MKPRLFKNGRLVWYAVGSKGIGQDKIVVVTKNENEYTESSEFWTKFNLTRALMLVTNSAACEHYYRDKYKPDLNGLMTGMMVAFLQQQT